jgi:uncharacterized protein YgiM (DUF1202 family)
MTTLKKGEEIEKIGESGTWTKVKLPMGDVGWIHNDFLRELGPRPLIPSSPAARTSRGRPGATPAPAAAQPEGPAQAVAAKPSKIMLATKEITKMRAEPNLTSKVVLVLKKGREVEKIGQVGQYTKVRLSWGDTGWVLSRSLEKVP